MKDYYGRLIKIGDKVRAAVYVAPSRGVHGGMFDSRGFEVVDMKRTRIVIEYSSGWLRTVGPELMEIIERDGQPVGRRDFGAVDPWWDAAIDQMSKTAG